MAKLNKDRVSGMFRRYRLAMAGILLVFFFGCRLGEMYRISGGDFLSVFSHMDYMVRTVPRIRGGDLGWGAVCALLAACFLYYQKLTAKKFRPGVEYGSAR